MVTEMNMRLKGPVCKWGKLHIFVTSVTSRFCYESAGRGARRRAAGAYPAGAIASASCWGA